jgi:hypothetical protein
MKFKEIQLKKRKKKPSQFPINPIKLKKKSNKKRKINDQGQPKLTYQTRVIRLG